MDNTVVSIEISPATRTLNVVGEASGSSATARNAAGFIINGVGFTWSSSNPAVATINETSGVITPVANGATTITAEANGISGTGVVTVTITAATVNTTDDLDDGTCDALHCSFREAIMAVRVGNAAGPILFNIPGQGPHTIQPTSALPALPENTNLVNLLIDGYSQPGASANSAPPGEGTNAVLMIEIDGSAGGGRITLMGRTTVQGLVLNRGASIYILGGVCCRGENKVQGNFIGTDVAGSFALGSSIGVWMSGDDEIQSDNRIGGTQPAERNLISGNSVGIRLSNNGGNIIEGNQIGTDASGTLAVGNGTGVEVMAVNNTIGGTTAAARNVISGNTGPGITFVSQEPPQLRVNVVQGNLIGADVSGSGPLGNGGDGIVIGRGSSANVEQLIGGVDDGAGNVIAFNTGNGVTFTRVLPDDRYATGTSILSNSIFANSGLGIDLDEDGVTLNDPGDVDFGTNELQNYPDIASAVAGASATTISGSLNSEPLADYRLEFFSSTACDSSGFGEGETLVGAAEVTTDGNGDANFDLVVPTAIAVGTIITATATVTSKATAIATHQSSSEFSQCIAVM